ncbi:hypothetical protein R3Q06_30555 [Rhodococcus erythropolis]|uniref:hypothetical protein n=1 Tax=Rhodococcus erythropolis TaxID=1833 RepID=UPI0029498A30|nr:hypothetical protein [Rhodococcus erythropolis]MDV6277837.1 hypothetical protein [Rhodococcus erythropolis]
MNIGTTRSRTKVKKALHTTAGIIAVAAAIGTGTGIGSATTPDPVTTPDTLQSGGPATLWHVKNRTGQPIYGQWDAWNAKGETSRVAATADNPWQPDAVAKSFQEEDSKWSGRICYNKQYWDFYPHAIRFGDSPGTLSLEVDSNNAPHARYTDRHTHPLGGTYTTDENVTLTATGIRC